MLYAISFYVWLCPNGNRSHQCDILLSFPFRSSLIVLIETQYMHKCLNVTGNVTVKPCQGSRKKRSWTWPGICVPVYLIYHRFGVTWSRTFVRLIRYQMINYQNIRYGNFMIYIHICHPRISIPLTYIEILIIYQHSRCWTVSRKIRYNWYIYLHCIILQNAMTQRV